MFRGTRRKIAVLAAAAGLVAGSVLWAASAASPATAAPSTAAAAVPPACTSGELAVWVNLEGGTGALGTYYYPLEFTNIGNHACRTYGYPGVSATNAAGKQLGPAAQRDPAFKAASVTIPAGGTVHALFGYIAAEVGTSGCKPATASLLKVYPPDQKGALNTFFSFAACTPKSRVYLTIAVIQPGTGI